MADIEIVDAWIGKNGIPSQVGTWQVPAEAGAPWVLVRVLRERGGCCAWAGRTACGLPPTKVAVGPMRLSFRVYREAHEKGGLCVALLCERHALSLTCDMPRKLKRDQGVEYEKALALLGVERPEDDELLLLTDLAEWL